MTDKVLHKGKFVELRLKEGDDFAYEYLHEHRCDGHIVAFLPYHKERGFLLRHEVTPCWGETEDGYHVNSFTGGWESDKHDTPVDTVIDELREEAGIILSTEDSIKSLGTCRGTKSSDSLYHLFSVDLDMGYEEVEPEADSALESREYAQWYKNSMQWIQKGVDPMLFVMYTRIQLFQERKVDRTKY